MERAAAKRPLSIRSILWIDECKRSINDHLTSSANGWYGIGSIQRSLIRQDMSSTLNTFFFSPSGFLDFFWYAKVWRLSHRSSISHSPRWWHRQKLFIQNKILKKDEKCAARRCRQHFSWSTLNGSRVPISVFLERIPPLAGREENGKMIKLRLISGRLSPVFLQGVEWVDGWVECCLRCVSSVWVCTFVSVSNLKEYYLKKKITNLILFFIITIINFF